MSNYNQSTHYQISLVKDGKILMTSCIFKDFESYNFVMTQLNLPGCQYQVNYTTSVNYMTEFPCNNESATSYETPTNYETCTGSYGCNGTDICSSSGGGVWSNNLEMLAEAASQQNGLFSDMTLEELNFRGFNGYLLIPPEGNKNFGKSNLHGAIWDNYFKGWCVNEKNLDFFLDNGAMWKLENESIDNIMNDEEIQPKIFDEMIFEDYDDKYLVQSYDNHPNYKDEIYNGGIWSVNGDGWLFPKNMKKFLEDNGAEYEDNSKVVFDNMVYTPSRGRGFKLLPEEDNKFYGLDKFLGKGLWRKTYWFFPSANHNYFTSKGAELLTYQ